jgi:hypothetical protein
MDDRMKLYNEELPGSVPDSKLEVKYSNKQATCQVCLEKILRNQQVVDLECGHTYHAHCARKWVLDTRTCPTCRKQVTPSTLSAGKQTAMGGDKSVLSYHSAQKSPSPPSAIASSIKQGVSDNKP